MFGINISQPGADVNSSNYQDKVFSSIKPSFSIRRKVTIPISSIITGSYSEKIYTHSFGYIPQVIAFVTTIAGEYVNIPRTWYYFENEPNQWITITEDFKCYADSVAVYIEVKTRAQGLYFSPMGAGFAEIDQYLAHNYEVDLLISMEPAALA